MGESTKRPRAAVTRREGSRLIGVDLKKKPTARGFCPGCGAPITPAQRDAPANPDLDPKSPPEPVYDVTGEHVGDLCLFCDRSIPVEDGDVIRALIKTRRHVHDDSTTILPSGRIADAIEINHLMYQWGAEERARAIEEVVGPAIRRSDERLREMYERNGWGIPPESPRAR